MSSSTLYRISGLALIVGGVASAILTIINSFAFPSNNNGFDPKIVTAAPWQIVNLLLLIAGIVVLLGLPGIYLRQAKQTGRLGLIGFILLAIAGLLFAVSLELVDVLVIPWVASVAPKLAEGNGPPAMFVFYIVVSIILVAGTVILGIATLRAGVLPRAAAWMLIVAGVINLANFAPLPSLLGNVVGALSTVLINLALAWFGYALLAVREKPAIESQTVGTDMSVPA